MDKYSNVIMVPITIDLTNTGKSIKVKKATKRAILRSHDILFDPLGLIPPIGFQDRVLFQTL